MSFFGGSTAAAPRPRTKLMNVDESTSTTNQEARPLPWFAGIQLLGLTWITPAMNLVTRKVKQSSGKDSTVIGAKYFADLAGAVCHGPVDALYKIYFDEEQVWGETPVTRGVEDYVELTTARGICRFYWGTETQVVDPILSYAPPDITTPKTIARTPQIHPPYRGQCYIVFDQVAFGQDTTNAPTVKVVVGRWPQPTGIAANPFIDLDVNPAAALLELLLNRRYGLGLDPSLYLDVTAFDALSDIFDGIPFGISPMLERQQEIRQILTQFAEYFFGWYRVEAGKLQVGIAQPAPDPGALAVLDESVLTEDPDLKANGWPTTFNQTAVTWSDRNRRFKETAAQWIDRGNFAITDVVRQQTLSRPWITKAAIARRVAAATGQISGVPGFSADISALRSVAAALKPGDLFKLVYGPLGLSDVCRVSELTIEKAEAAAIALAALQDLSALATAWFLSSDDNFPPELIIDTNPDAIVVSKIIELPKGLVGEYKTTVSSLATRSDPATTSYNIHRSNDDVSYHYLANHDRFIIGAELAEDYVASTLLVDDDRGMLLDLNGTDFDILVAQDEDAWLDNTLLLFVGNEILSIRDVEWITTTRVRLKGLTRGRYGSPREFNGTGAHAYIIAREDLNLLQHSSFGPNHTRYFKLAPVTASGEADLDALTSIPHAFGDDPLTLQPLRLLNLTANGSGHDARWAIGQDLDVAWSNTTWLADAFWSRWAGASDLDGMTRLVQLLALDDTVVLQDSVGGDNETRSFTSSEIDAAFGTADFKVRVTSKRGSHLNSQYLELTVANDT